MLRRVKRWALAGVVIVGIGCNGNDEPEAPRTAEPTTETTANPTGTSLFDGKDPMHLPMAQAVRTSDDPPPGTDAPPDATSTGVSTFSILKKVQESWETIRFRTPGGKPIEYTAVLDTDLGTIEIELRPDVAPNHVRSFVALARAGYYDGLSFDRIQAQQSEAEEVSENVRLEQIEAGNPRGVEKLNGSVGYWLLPEISDKLKHEPGTVGSCLEGAPDPDSPTPLDSAGCRFYITLTEDPLLDGTFTPFGKVKTGLEIARRIYKQPVVSEDSQRDGLRRPEKPVVIRKVTIRTRSASTTEGAP